MAAGINNVNAIQLIGKVCLMILVVVSH